MEFRVLGPITVTVPGRSLALGDGSERSLLAILLAQPNRIVPAERLLDELWPGQDPGRAAAALQVRLSGLRKAFRSAGEENRLATEPPGYRLAVSPQELDALRFAALVRLGQEALEAGEPRAAGERLDEGLALWRGPAFAGIDLPSVQADGRRLDELRLTALEARAQARLDSGRPGEAAAELEALTAGHPLRERFWQLRMLALYRSGRQADALRCYQDLQALLADELGIDPGPALRELQARILRQDPGLEPPAGDGSAQPPAGDGSAQPSGRTGTAREHGIRPVPSWQPPVPQTRYVQTADGVHLAYQVLGYGARDIVFVPGLMSHLDLLWEDPETAEFFRRLALLGRLILFDKRDTGLSDRAPAECTLEERMDDLQAVMRAAGSSRAVLFGYSEGAPMSILFAASHPARVSALILGSAAARWLPAPGYPCGESGIEAYRALREIAARRWGQGDTIDWCLPSRADSAHARRLVARFERLAVTPSAFLRLLEITGEIDVRAALPAVRVPTLVIQRSDDRINPPCHGRYLAARIPGARYFEQPGDHSLRFAGSGDGEELIREISDFLAERAQPAEPERVLVTMLWIRMAGPAAGAAAVMRRFVQAHRGSPVGGTGPGWSGLATFPAPGRAIRCALAVREHAAGLGLGIGCGIHSGEVQPDGDGLKGSAVRITERVSALARPGEILLTRTVRDLLAGSAILLVPHGEYPLDPAEEAWALFRAQ